MIYCKTTRPCTVRGFTFKPGIYCGLFLPDPLCKASPTIWVEGGSKGLYYYLVPTDNPPAYKPDLTQPFDFEEFLWIKMQAKNWNDISGIPEPKNAEN